MALGKRQPQQADLWLAVTDLPQTPAHPFYAKLNGLLTEAGFDPFVEDLCRPYYAESLGRPSSPSRPAPTSACSSSVTSRN